MTCKQKNSSILYFEFVARLYDTYFIIFFSFPFFFRLDVKKKMCIDRLIDGGVGCGFTSPPLCVTSIESQNFSHYPSLLPTPPSKK